MSKIKDATDVDGSFYRHMFMCPGCNEYHGVDNTWEFNGNYEHPTLSPSVLVEWIEAGTNKRCHSFVREGRIEFLGDCTHGFAGSTVDLPEVES